MPFPPFPILLIFSPNSDTPGMDLNIDKPRAPNSKMAIVALSAINPANP